MVYNTLNRPTIAFLVAAAAANLVAIAAGLGAGMAYLSAGESSMAGAFRQHRAVHLQFGIAWIYLAGVAIAYHAMSSRALPGLGRRARWHLALWCVAGIASLSSLVRGQFSGRLYLEAPGWWSIAVLAGWLLMARSFWLWCRARGDPLEVHHYMWGMSLCLFITAFAEAHLHALPEFSNRPVRDISVQWKSYGTLVGTFNLLVYAGVSYVGALRAADTGRRPSNLAFALFLVGALNTFTNYGHHTFHVPQSLWIPWAGFLVSITEIVIVFALLGELLGSSPDGNDLTARLLRWGRFWSAVMVVQAILLSIPPINTLAHGTHLVMVHAMGSMIGIDTILLLACVAELRARSGLAPTRRSAIVVRFAVRLVNLGLGAVMVALVSRGTADATLRALGPLSPAPPDALRHWSTVFLCGGASIAAGMIALDLEMLARLLPALRRGWYANCSDRRKPEDPE